MADTPDQVVAFSDEKGRVRAWATPSFLAGLGESLRQAEQDILWGWPSNRPLPPPNTNFHCWIRVDGKQVMAIHDTSDERFYQPDESGGYMTMWDKVGCYLPGQFELIRHFTSMDY